MEVKVTLNCEVKYILTGFDELSGYYTPKEFERVYDTLKKYNTDISHEIIEGAAHDNDGFVIVVMIVITNLDR